MEQKIVMYQTQVKKKTSSELFVFAENILWEFKEESQKKRRVCKLLSQSNKNNFPQTLNQFRNMS